MRIMSSYFSLAQSYNLLTGNISYEKRCEYFDGLIKKYSSLKGKNLLDLGCGTGTLSEELAKLGYNCIGLDNSEEMLAEAASNREHDIFYICQDMREIELLNPVDITICALDGINHLLTEADLKKCFDGVSRYTNIGGLFIFDVNTAYKHEKILANNSFVYDLDDVYCVWSSTLLENSTVELCIDVFERKDDAYFRSSESFCERAYSGEALDRLLEESGFEVLEHFDWDSENPPKEDSEKIIFVAKKVR